MLLKQYDSKKHRDSMSGTGESGDRQYDLSFIYRIQWRCPAIQIKEAFRLALLSPLAEPCAIGKPVSASHELTGEQRSHMAETRRMLACNPDTPPPVLEHLAKESSVEVLERVAENAGTPAETLSRLAWDSSPSVRSSVAENANTPVESFWLLAFDDCIDVRYMLAESAHVPEEVLKRLTEDDNPYVALRAQRTVERIASSTGSIRQTLSKVFTFVRRVLGSGATA